MRWFKLQIADWPAWQTMGQIGITKSITDMSVEFCGH